MEFLVKAAAGKSAPPGAFKAIDSDFGGNNIVGATLFENSKTGERVLAFRGSEFTATDWTTNFEHGIGMRTQQYQLAITIAEGVVEDYGKGNLSIAGHSKGGGAAAIASMATGIPSRTFNAAGSLASESTRLNAKGLVHNYYNWGDMLTGTQEYLGFNRALGSQTILDPADGKSGLLGDALASYDRHGIDSIIESLQKKILNDCY